MRARAPQDHPSAEWYMWIDSDAMIVDPAFEIPFHKFGGKDLVAWGNEERLRAGDALAGACGPQWGCRLPRDEPAALKTSTEALAARRAVACQGPAARICRHCSACLTFQCLL